MNPTQIFPQNFSWNILFCNTLLFFYLCSLHFHFESLKKSYVSPTKFPSQEVSLKCISLYSSRRLFFFWIYGSMMLFNFKRSQKQRCRGTSSNMSASVCSCISILVRSDVFQTLRLRTFRPLFDLSRAVCGSVSVFAFVQESLHRLCKSSCCFLFLSGQLKARISYLICM